MNRSESAGLRNVEAVESSITAITPEGLFLRGIPLDALVTKATFEELAFLLWYDRRPSGVELRDFRAAYTKAWALPFEAVTSIQALPAADLLGALQVALPFFAAADPDRNDISFEADERRAVRVLAQIPAALACRYWGRPVARLDPANSLAQQVLRALGSKPLPPAVADAALILYADHELAASTFAARIVAAALGGLYDGISAGLAVLRGPLHGGSTPNAAALLRRLAEAPRLDSAIAGVLAEGQRLPGFGHAVYAEGDPRAAHFRRLTDQIATGEARRWLQTAVALEERVTRERGLHANVDLYGAAFMHAAGLRDNAMLALFAVARASGWLAHMLEQKRNNRLIRPRARYTGSLGRSWETPSLSNQ
jgi:citrate synthase